MSEWVSRSENWGLGDRVRERSVAGERPLNE